MQIKDWGEERWVQYLKEQFSQCAAVGIGDDCAVIPSEQDRAWLVTTDVLVEGIHFLKDQISPSELGYKTVAVNVSDIAAMGGCPNYAFLSIALPNTVDCNWICDLVQGIKEACQQWNIFLMGGDTVGSKRDIFLNATLIGSAPLNQIKYRNQAKPGDVICVTGYLGDAGAGLQALQESIEKTQNIQYLIHSHFHPHPHLQEGMWLASHSSVHAMMDLSDGLACDLKRMMMNSQCGAVIETSKIPFSDPLTEVCLYNQWDPLKLALTGGEDYCLLLTVSPDAFPAIQRSYQERFHCPLHEIGNITDQPNQLVYNENDKSIQLDYLSYNHFK